MPRDVAKRKLRAGIVGGGQGAFIGAIHRIAAELDDEAELVAGAMSSDPQRARAFNRATRSYSTARTARAMG